MKLQDYFKKFLLQESKEYGGLSSYISMYDINEFVCDTKEYHLTKAINDFLNNELIKERDNKLKIILK